MIHTILLVIIICLQSVLEILTMVRSRLNKVVVLSIYKSPVTPSSLIKRHNFFERFMRSPGAYGSPFGKPPPVGVPHCIRLAHEKWERRDGVVVIFQPSTNRGWTGGSGDWEISR